jgi:hypothetical protein
MFLELDVLNIGKLAICVIYFFPLTYGIEVPDSVYILAAILSIAVCTLVGAGDAHWAETAGVYDAELPVNPLLPSYPLLPAYPILPVNPIASYAP